MPNTNICIYLSDEEYVKYVENKVEINQKVKSMVKKGVE